MNKCANQRQQPARCHTTPAAMACVVRNRMQRMRCPRRSRRSVGASVFLQQPRALENLLNAAPGDISRGRPVQRHLRRGVSQTELECAKGRGGVCDDGIVVLCWRGQSEVALMGVPKCKEAAGATSAPLPRRPFSQTRPQAHSHSSRCSR